jgi:hypothetical protein
MVTAHTVFDMAAIKSGISLFEVVSEIVRLRKYGNLWKGLCPFHSEKTPSLTVDPERKKWRCFGCGRSGDAVDFIAAIENVDLKTARKLAAARAGIDLSVASSPEDRRQAAETAERRGRERAALAEAVLLARLQRSRIVAEIRAWEALEDRASAWAKRHMSDETSGAIESKWERVWLVVRVAAIRVPELERELEEWGCEEFYLPLYIEVSAKVPGIGAALRERFCKTPEGERQAMRLARLAGMLIKQTQARSDVVSVFIMAFMARRSPWLLARFAVAPLGCGEQSGTNAETRGRESRAVA